MSSTVFTPPESRTSFIPLTQLFPALPWPEDQFEGGDGVLDRVFATSWSGSPGFFALELFTETEIALKVPGIDGLELVLGAPLDATTPGIAFGAEFSFQVDLSALDPEHPLAETPLIGWSLALTGLALRLRWDTDLLVAMADDGAGGFVETGQPYGVTFGGVVTLTDDWGLHFEGGDSVDLPPVQLGHTGIIVRATEVTPYLANEPTPPELAALGYGDTFRGIWMDECEVILPKSWGGAATSKYTTAPPPLDVLTDSSGRTVPDADGTEIPVPPAVPVYVGPRITFANCAIGTGGFSGDVAFDVDATTDLGDEPLPNLVPAVEESDLLTDAEAGVRGLSAELFGFGLALQRFQLGIRRNAIVSTAINGSLKVPFLDTWFDVEVTVAGDGEFEVSLATETGAPLVDVTIRDVVAFQIDSLGFDDPGGGAPVGVVVNGSVRPLLPIGGGSWPELDLTDLTIYSDGSIKLDGGWIALPTQYAVDFFGFQLELSKLGFGTGSLDQSDDAGGSDGWRWVGLSGAIRLVEELAISGAVDGLKIAWRRLANGEFEFEWDWSLSGIGVNASTDVFYLAGAVEFIQDDDGGAGFRGAVSLSLVTFGVGFDAEFVVARTAQAPDGFAYWGVILGVDLPAGIPLGPTGIAFYGLQGLGLQNLTPAIAPPEEWYDGWYTKPDLFGQTGVTLDKFEPAEGALGFGLGVTLGTAPDNGFMVNAKALALLLFPGPTILITGKGGFLAQRSALSGSEQPPFDALLVIDGSDGSVLLNIAAQYSLIDEHVLEIAGDAEAFFSAGDPADWYLHLGERPLDDRISVTVLSLFEALGYLSIEQTGLATGFRIGYGESRRFGKLELGFDVHISGDGALSFDRLSVHGKGELAGSIHASAFGVGMSLAAQASVAASAFSPLSVSAEAKVEVDLPTPLPTLSPDVKLVWRNTKKPAYANPFTALRLVHPATAEEWEPATGETAAPVVPMDARPVLTLSHAVADALGIGQPAAYVTDPPPETVGDYEIRYTLTGVTLEYRPLGGGAFVPVDDLYGVWLLEGAAPADDPAEAEGTAERVTTKLELWGRTPFSYEDHTTVPTLSTAVADDPAFPCGPDVDLTPTCTDWQEDRPRTRYPLVFTHGGLEFGSNRVTEVAAEPPLTEDTGLDRALALRPDTSLVGALPGPCSGVTTLVESLGTVIVEAWGRSPDGAATLLESHTIHGRNEGLLTIAATGVEQLVYRARPSEDCAPWSWQLPGTTTGIHSGQGEAVPDDPNLPSPITTVPCSTLLYQVCWVEESRTGAADQLAERRQAFSEWTEAWTGSARIFGPNTTYRLTVSIDASGVDAARTFTQTVYFRTLGPPGFLAGLGESSADGKGALLADLGLYTERTSPPAGAGQSAAAPAHYRAHDVVVLYNRDTVKELYAGGLGLELRDANGTPVAGLDGRTLFEAEFTDPSQRALTTGETVFLKAIDGADCSSVTLEVVTPSDTQGFTLPVLAPGMLYRARILGGWSPDLGIDASGEVTVGGSGPLADTLVLREVLHWEFVTSRYEGFAEHLASYDPAADLWDNEYALRPSGLDQAAVATLLGTIQPGPWDEDEKVVTASLLDLLGIRPRVAPGQVEVTVVRAGTDAIALLVDSPEPLDWARITVAVSNASNGHPIGHVLARARDGRRALVFRSPDGTLLRSFRVSELAVEWTYDLAVQPARYRDGVSGTETGTLTVPLATASRKEEGP